MPRRRRGGGLPHGFVSKAQWRFFWANARLRRFARKEAHKTPGGPVARSRRLPLRKGVRKRA
jgi:hypothetical protein